MRIAFVTTSYPRDEGDPSGHFVRAEVRALAREGHEVVVIAPDAGGAFGWPGVAARVRARPWRAVDAATWPARGAWRLARVGVVDRVVAHWAVPSAWPIALAVSAPLEVVSHGGDVRALLALPSPVRRALVSAIARRAEVWRFVSAELRAALVEGLGDRALARRVIGIARVAPSPIEIPEVKERAAAIRATHGAFVVVVGRLVRSKRVDRVIARAAATGERVVVVGDGPERERLEALARRAGARVTFVGDVERAEAVAWIAAAEGLVVASEAEGFSTVVREAEAVGTRVVRI